MNLQLVYRYILDLSKKWKYVLRENNKKTKAPLPPLKKKNSLESRTQDPRRGKWTRYLLRHNTALDRPLDAV